MPWRRALVPLVAALLLVAGLGDLRTDHLQLSDADVTPERLAQYEWFTGNIGTTVSAEYLPPTVQPRPYTSAWLNHGARDAVRALRGELLARRLLERRSTHQTWQVETREGATLQFPTLYWPGWEARLNGTSIPLRPSPGSGLIMLDVAEGLQTVELQLTRTPLRLAAELLSLLGLLLALWLLRPTRWQRAAQALLALAAGIVLLMGIARLAPTPTLAPDNLNWDFAQMGYLHHAGAGVAFENGMRLERYTFSSETAVAGQPFSVTLHFSGADGRLATLALASPAVTWPAFDPAAPVVSAQTQPLRGDSVTFTLEVPANAPAGLLLPRLTVAEARPLTPSGRTRGDLFLRPVAMAADATWFRRATRPLEARAVQGQARDEQVLDLQLAWWTERPLSTNHNVSLRLLDGTGKVLSQWDGQPGYGFQPSSVWLPQTWMHDWLALTLPAERPSERLALVAQLYDVASGEAVLVRRLGELDPALNFTAQAPRFNAPANLATPTAVFGDTVQLLGYCLEERTNATLVVTLVWQALTDGTRDYTRFVHLLAPESDTIVAQNDAFPLGNSYPTSQWQAGEVVVEQVALDLRNASPGLYRLVAGFYDAAVEGLPRLTAVDPSGAPFPSNRVPLTTPHACLTEH